MQRNDVEELGPRAFTAVVRRLEELPSASDDFLGWDSEYTSKGSEFLSFQLFGANGGKLYTPRAMTVDRLAAAARELGVLGEVVYLVSFFAIAELQFLPVVRESFDWRLYGSGSLDVSFTSKRWRLEIRTVDLARFFDKQSLAQVAESFGLKKLDYQTSRVSRSSLKSPRFRKYALHDAELCFEITRRLRVALHGPDPLVHRTGPACAAALFRHRHLTADLHPPEPRQRLLAMLSCWGGRAEAFHRGSFPRVLEYDLASAYPRAALALDRLPVRGSWRSLRIGNLRNRRWIGGFARVRFRFPDAERYPCLPVLHKGMLLYPLQGETFATLAEIELARELGAQLYLVEGFAYADGSRDLAHYMKELLAERAQATGARKVALKLLANGLIGKLAQRTTGIDVEELRKLALESGVDVGTLATVTIEEAKALGVSTEPKLGAVFYPEWNGLITGFVRAQVSKLARDHAAIYCATDAIWTTKPARKIPEGCTLKREGRGIVARTRLGMIEERGGKHVAHHGIWSKSAALELLTGDLDGTLTYEARRPTKLKEALREGKRYGKWESYEREASGRWDGKRKLHPDGSTSPWRSIQEFEEGAAEARRARRSEAARRRREEHG